MKLLAPIEVTFKAGEHCANPSWEKKLTLAAGSYLMTEIEAQLGEIPAGANRYWYFAGYTIDGKNSLRGGITSSLTITADTTEITLFYNDGGWEVYDDTYEYTLSTSNFGETTGELELLWDGSTNIATYSYSYNLDDNTITLTDTDGTEFKGTLGTDVKPSINPAAGYSGEFKINITLKVKDATYTFGTGSPATSGTETEGDPYAGTTWTGNDCTATFSADGNFEIQYSNWKLVGKYTYDAEAGFSFSELAIQLTSQFVKPRLEITAAGSTSLSVKITVEDYDEGYDIPISITLTKQG